MEECKNLLTTVRLIFLGALLICVVGVIAKAEPTEKVINWTAFYDELTEENELLKVYDSADLTAEILSNRNGDLIIEKVYGVVVNTEGDGIALESNEDFVKAHNRDYNSIADNYISYKSVEGAEENDIVLTYFIYNPDSNYTDDIIERFDYIIDDKSN
jgi:hypothetical protein